MLRVWFIWTATKSSYRVFAPGYLVGFNLDGAFVRHKTALMYDDFSASVRSPLLPRQNYCELLFRHDNGCKTYHSLRTCSLALLHVVDFASCASSEAWPLVHKSNTASALTTVVKRRSCAMSSRQYTSRDMIDGNVESNVARQARDQLLVLAPLIDSNLQEQNGRVDRKPLPQLPATTPPWG